MIRTFKYRLKSKNLSFLKKASNDVNFVWNYCNDTSIQFIKKKDQWLTGYQLCSLTSGCSVDLAITAETIQTVCQEYAKRRYQYKKNRLSWRSKKRSLGWVPFKNGSIRVIGDLIIYKKVIFRFWQARPIDGVIKSGSFIQDSKGNWYICMACECATNQKVKSGGQVGIDLGLKSIATLSNGTILNRANITLKYAKRLAAAQRARKKKQVTKIHAKIKNARKDWNHKQTTKLINSFDRIIVGNVSSSKLKRTRFAKSVTDASWYQFKSMLAYKAIALGVEYKEINEKFSTVTCSNCFERTGPSGLSALGVREWTCRCGASHSRDVNAARNILRFGCEAPIKGSLYNHIEDTKLRATASKKQS